MKTRHLFAAFLFVCLISGIAVRAANEANVPEAVLPGLNAVLEKALQQSPQMLNRALSLQIAENDRIQARANLLPSLNASYRYYKAQDERVNANDTFRSTKEYYDIGLSQPLFYWGERKNTAKIGEIQALIAKGQYQDGYRMFAREVRGLYLSLIVQKIALERAAFYLRYTQAMLKEGEERLQKKVISDAEMFSVRLTAEQAQLAWERSSNDFESSRQGFIRVTGLSDFTDAMIPDAIPALHYQPAVYDRLLASYLGQKELPTTEAYVARQQLVIQELNYANAKTRLRPKFNFAMGVSQDEQQGQSGRPEDRYALKSSYAGINASWAIFDGFAARAATKNALLRKRQMESDYRELTSRLAQQAQSQVKQINFSARSMSISDRYLVSGEGNLKSKREEFNRGVISENDVNIAQLGLYDARLNAYNSRSDYLNRVADFLGTVMQDPVLNTLSNQ